MAIREYQYETSPRKIDLEYRRNTGKKITNKKNIIKKKKKKSNNSSITKVANKTNKSNKTNNTKKSTKTSIKTGFFVTLNLFMIVGILFIIIYRNSLISQSFAQIQGLKHEVTEIQKENDQLEISIQNSLNINNIEQSAKDLLGMQKLNSKQTIYLTLPKKDYVEPSTEEIIIDNKEKSFFEKIIEFINGLF